jgi:Double zinc ribbon
MADFFDSSAWSLISVLLQVSAVVFWLALAFWTFQDARRRVRDSWLIVGAVILSVVLPVLGTLVYLLLRPPEYLIDAHERELEVAALEARIEGERCPECDYPTDRKFLSCPQCLRKLREPCMRCSEPLDPRWKICPYCESVTPGMSTSPVDRLTS